MKKKILSLIIIMLVICGCSREEKRTLNVLNWSSYIPDEIIREFEQKTGINVNYSTYSSNEELLAKLSSSKEGTYDLVFPSDYMVEIMINRDMLDNIDISKLSNYRNLNIEYLSLEFDKSNKYSLPFLYATSVIAINRNYIKDSISSYNDLLNSKYKNSIVILDDQRFVIGMALLAEGFSMNSTDDTELDVAKRWLSMLKDNIKAYDSDCPKNFLITEETYIGFMWDAEAKLAKEENHNIEIIYPIEGVGISLDNFVLPKGGKHKEEAYEFIDYILDSNVMYKIIESYPYNSVNTGTDLLMKNKKNYIDFSYSNNKYFVKNIGDGIKKYDKLWAEIK